MSGELKKLLILTAGVLSFFLIITISNNLPSIFTEFQRTLFFGTGLSVILVVVVISVTKWWKG
jgi:hypothetical protein